MSAETIIALAAVFVALGAALLQMRQVSHNIKKDIKSVPTEDFKSAIDEAKRSGAMDVTIKQIEKNTETLIGQMGDTQREIRAMGERLSKAESAVLNLNNRMDTHLRASHVDNGAGEV